MKFSDLKETINNFTKKIEVGKKIKQKHLKKILNKLEAKKQKYEKIHAKENSAKVKKKLKLQQKVVKAHIKKARKLLKDLAS